MKRGLIKTEAVVLKTVKTGEADRIINLYTKHYGKLQSIAKGVRKPGSRFGGSLEPGNILQIMIYYKDDNSLGIIRETEVINFFQKTKSDLKKMVLSLYFIDLLDIMVRPKDTHLSIYSLLLTVFDLLENSQYNPGLARMYEYELLNLTGVMPEFYNCSSCKKELKDRIFIDLSNTGVHCEDCSDNTHILFQADTIQYINNIKTEEFENMMRVKLTERINDQLKTLFSSIIANYAGTDIKSVNILKKL